MKIISGILVLLLGVSVCFGQVAPIVSSPAGPIAVPGLTVTTTSGGGTVPVGAVIQFAGSVAPTGWLMCDGSAVGTNNYPALFAVIGVTYGGQRQI